MKKSLTIISRGAVFLTGAAVVMFLGVLMPEFAREEAISNPNAGPIFPYFLGAWILSIPIFISLHQTLKLLEYIDKNNAFSPKSVKALQIIKLCTIAFAILIFISAIIVVTVAKAIDPKEDVAPVGTIGFVFIFTTIIITAFVAVLQKLLKIAIKIQSENELAV